MYITVEKRLSAKTGNLYPCVILHSTDGKERYVTIDKWVCWALAGNEIFKRHESGVIVTYRLVEDTSSK